MKIIFSKIMLSLVLLCSIAFAGGTEEDSGPEEINEQITEEETKDSPKEHADKFEVKLKEYQGLSGDCYVIYFNDRKSGYVNDPDYVTC